MDRNKKDAGIKPSQKYHRLCDGLNEEAQSRLDILESEIDRDLVDDEDISNKIVSLRDKTDEERSELMQAIVPYNKDTERNAYNYEYIEQSRMEEINERLKNFMPLTWDEDQEETKSDNGSVYAPSMTSKRSKISSITK